MPNGGPTKPAPSASHPIEALKLSAYGIPLAWISKVATCGSTSAGAEAALSMTAPERFADSQIPLAPRAPSIHDPTLEIGRRRKRRLDLERFIIRSAPRDLPCVLR